MNSDMASILLLLLCALVCAAHALPSSHRDSRSAGAVCLSDFQCQTQLSPDLLLRYKLIVPRNVELNSFNFGSEEGGGVDCPGCEIIVQMLYDGYAWLGIGPSPDGVMVGTRAVIGAPDLDLGPEVPTAYSLDGKTTVGVAPLADPSEFPLESNSVQYLDGQTIMEFRTSFATWGITGNSYSFVWAHGGEGAELGYHAGRSSHALSNLMGFTEEAIKPNTAYEVE